MSDNWNNNLVIKLIEMNEQETVLWNDSMSSHKNSSSRLDAIHNIANTLDKSDIEFEKKLHTLKSQFLREKAKITKSKKSGAGTKEVYVPKWKYYQLLLFLSPSAEPVSHTSSLKPATYSDMVESARIDLSENLQNDEQSNTSVADSMVGDINEENSDPIVTGQSETVSKRPPTKVSGRSLKRKCTEKESVEAKFNEAYDVFKSSVNKPKDQDSLFGEYVGETLRGLTDPTMKSSARHEINNILFQAENGGQNLVLPYSSGFPQNTPQGPQGHQYQKTPVNCPSSAYYSGSSSINHAF